MGVCPSGVSVVPEMTLVEWTTRILYVSEVMLYDFNSFSPKNL